MDYATASFDDLHNAPLHAMTDAAWTSWYPRMQAYLTDPAPQRREAAVERLCMAVMRAELQKLPERRAHDARYEARLRWLLDTVTRATEVHGDVLDAFLKNLRWHGDDEPFTAIMLPWLDQVAATAASLRTVSFARGATVLLAPHANDDAAQLQAWLDLLDDPSDWVRGTAARRLATYLENPIGGDALVARISEVELQRPGVAGPFWGEHLIAPSSDGWTRERIGDLMLDLLERRPSTPTEGELPFNDIAFHLHEVCSRNPRAVRRMIDGGFIGLALMTALEETEPIAGMRPLIEELTRHQDHDVARYAQNALRSFDQRASEARQC
jgi:hypothetical protein